MDGCIRFVEANRLTIHELASVTTKAKSLRDSLRTQSERQIKDVVRRVLDRITLEPGKLTLAINRKNLAVELGVQSIES